MLSLQSSINCRNSATASTRRLPTDDASSIR
nr:MAG TPA: hypothetical protein [Caudoviricetes sp.]